MTFSFVHHRNASPFPLITLTFFNDYYYLMVYFFLSVFVTL